MWQRGGVAASVMDWCTTWDVVSIPGGQLASAACVVRTVRPLEDVCWGAVTESVVGCDEVQDVTNTARGKHRSQGFDGFGGW